MWPNRYLPSAVSNRRGGCMLSSSWGDPKPNQGGRQADIWVWLPWPTHRYKSIPIVLKVDYPMVTTKYSMGDYAYRGFTFKSVLQIVTMAKQIRSSIGCGHQYICIEEQTRRFRSMIWCTASLVQSRFRRLKKCTRNVDVHWLKYAILFIINSK